MTTTIHQRSKIPFGNGVKVSNNFKKKHIHINRIPPGSTIRVDKSFVKPERLKQRMSKIKASPRYKLGEVKERNKLTLMKIKKRSTIEINASTS